MINHKSQTDFLGYPLKVIEKNSDVTGKIILYFSILLHQYISYPLASVYNATQRFIFKISFTIIFKIHKMSLKSHFLFNCCNMFRPYKAIIRQLLLDRHHRTEWATRQYIYLLLLHVVIIRETVCPHFTHAIFLLRRPRCVPFSRACVPCVHSWLLPCKAEMCCNN
jgi:hypothetical protein